MSGHTPGPWVAGVTHKRGVLACVMAAPNEEGFTSWVCSIQSADINKANANARLIASAPDLLKALTELVANQDASWLELGFTTEQIKAMPYLKPARAAIEKATGEKA